MSDASPAAASDELVVGPERLVCVGNITTLARKEIRDSLRNRWFVLYSLAFAVLATALSFLSLAGTSTFGFAGYGRTAASLINLVILIVPLMGLTAGAGSVAAERESRTLAYLLAQPVTRFELLTGKYLGLALALIAALAIGFGASALLIAARQHVGVADFARLIGLSCVLALSMLSVGVLISTVTRKASTAFGAAIVLWLVLVFLGDLGLMGSTLVFKLQVADLFQLSLLNPLQVFKMAALGSIHASLDVLGPAGLYATQTFGDALPWIFAGALAAWTVLPLAAAFALFTLRGDA
ncbi:MAG: ABC transporter permease [Planctomycetota bacterium]